MEWPESWGSLDEKKECQNCKELKAKVEKAKEEIIDEYNAFKQKIAGAVEKMHQLATPDRGSGWGGDDSDYCRGVQDSIKLLERKLLRRIQRAEKKIGR